MRKIEKRMLAAVCNGVSMSCGNTRVECVNGVSHVYLHGNCIAIVNQNMDGQFCLAGWNSNTTRSRLRALGVSVRCRNYTPQMEVNGKWVDIRSNEWYDVEG